MNEIKALFHGMTLTMLHGIVNNNKTEKNIYIHNMYKKRNWIAPKKNGLKEYKKLKNLHTQEKQAN